MLTRCTMAGRGRASDAEVEMPVAHLVEVRGERVTWIKTYSDLDAAGREFEAATRAPERQP